MFENVDDVVDLLTHVLPGQVVFNERLAKLAEQSRAKFVGFDLSVFFFQRSKNDSATIPAAAPMLPSWHLFFTEVSDKMLYQYRRIVLVDRRVRLLPSVRVVLGKKCVILRVGLRRAKHAKIKIFTGKSNDCVAGNVIAVRWCGGSWACHAATLLSAVTSYCGIDGEKSHCRSGW